MQADIPAKDIMTREVCTGNPDETLFSAAKRMLEFGVGSIVVVEDHKPLGIVTEKDILEKVVAKNRTPSEVKLKEIMSYPLITIKPTTSVREAADIMLKRGIRRLPVIDDGDLIGIVTDTDILGVSLDLGELMGLVRERSFGSFNFVEEMGGKCERCGRFSEHLIEVDGLKLCEDCAETFG
ncbi:CBS domain-containing protein [Archaeoglobus veneficus]|uniref:Putative signal transduction protein with CBS domains n=1 Tax=Archaeoglobus veneficus (strain DSM 11195 / SNP6) TaxID=693661 RepID=F2KP78_ARCVS|nr:CBS domain-containing protein [Archaeoglobus veneficus]AEA47482.1 putative signal transduction protein with CBS domains [Archaeoglobus veneficus SNP6]